MAQRARRLAIALGAAAAGCAASHEATVGPGTAGERAVVIDNRTGTTLWLCRARRDAWDDPMPLGSATTIAVRLAPGRYALRIGADGPSAPLPLPAAELGFVPPPATKVTVWPWPAPQPGWCWIPGGLGLRGDDLGIGQEDERPVATPELPGFWLAERETTNAQFAAFLNALPRGEVNPTWLDLEGRKCRVHWDPEAGRFTTDAPELPVVTVAWAGADAYCRWLTATTGVSHRLPTETEWEKAARGPGSRVYSYGDTYRTDAANQESGELLPGGSFPAGGFDLRDMTGNAFEWTADPFVRGAYGGRHPATDQAGEYRALRGGSFVLDGIFVRNSMRMRLRPEVRADDVGFRVLRVATDPAFGSPLAPHQP